MRFRYVLLLLSIVLLNTASALAAFPQTISYQGYLKDTASNVPVSASMSMTFSLYSTATGGTAIWSESKAVEVNNGIYSTALGSTSALSSSFFNNQLYLGIRLSNTSSELSPRQALTGTPYAMQAGCNPGDLVECYSGQAVTRNVGACKPGRRTCASNGTWGPCIGETLPTTEITNGIDDNCDGILDNLPCGGDMECKSGEYCDTSGKCLVKLPLGSNCSRAGQCSTTFCTLGICTSTPGCTVASDCGTSNACRTFTCNTGVCSTQNAPAGDTPNQIAGDCATSQCDGSGNTIYTINDADIPADDGNSCTNEICSGGKPSHPNKSVGTSCNSNGGTICNGSGTCAQCLMNADCPGGYCSNGVCAQPTCMDMLKNGAETDVDCGGIICAKCDLGMTCSINADCLSGNCNAGTCASVDLCAGVYCPPLDQCHTVGTCNPSTGTCFNPAKTNGTACNDGNSCTSNDACQSGICAGTPIGGCVQPLALGSSCAINSDCASGFCVDGFCCNSACSGECQTCSGTGGTCNNVTGQPTGGRPPCLSGTSCSGTAAFCQ